MPTINSYQSAKLTYWDRSSGLAAWQGPKYVSFYNREEMVSIDHSPFPNGSSDQGGPWILRRSHDLITPGSTTTGLFRGQFTVGNMTPQGGLALLPFQTEATDSEQISAGTTAIARSEPTNPAFQMSTALGELASDGLPTAPALTFWKERAQAARGAGSEYLNHQFGWMPLLSDIRKFASAVKDSEKILHQYKKDSGTKIRRGYQFPATDDTRVQQGSFGPTSSALGWLTGTLIERRSAECWFKGAFRYHIPTNDTQLGKFRQWSSMSDHLLGWKVTPETLWNIAPWSWAVDWFSNTGDVMHNVSALGRDGLVLQYGYVMNHRRSERTVSAQTSTKVPTARVVIYETKQRMPSTPFGFGVNLSTLSPRQIAITAALGLSRT